MRLPLRILTAAVFFLTGCAAPEPKAPPPPAPIRVLIVDGFSNHDWQLTTTLIRKVLEKSGGFEVSVSTCPMPAESPEWKSWRPGFAAADVVLQNCNDYGNAGRWPDAVKRDLENYVAGGGGLMVFHSANNAFATWPEYNRMIGLGWRKRDFGKAVTFDENGVARVIPAGEGKGTSHGERIDAPMTRVGDHPIHRGLPRRWVSADVEVYSYARGPAENLTVLSYALDPVTAMRWPTEWTVAYGKGRVYTATYGHVWGDVKNPGSLRCVAMRTLLVRSLQWLAGRPVDETVPADFPGPDKASLRE